MVSKFRKKPVVIYAEQFVVYEQNERPVSKNGKWGAVSCL